MNIPFMKKLFLFHKICSQEISHIEIEVQLYNWHKNMLGYVSNIFTFFINLSLYIKCKLLDLAISAYLQWLWTRDLRALWGDLEAWSQRSLTSTTTPQNVPATSRLCGVSKMITIERNILFHVKILDNLEICLNIFL